MSPISREIRCIATPPAVLVLANDAKASVFPITIYGHRNQKNLSMRHGERVANKSKRSACDRPTCRSGKAGKSTEFGFSVKSCREKNRYI